jgi:hypothetical protein
LFCALDWLVVIELLERQGVIGDEPRWWFQELGTIKDYSDVFESVGNPVECSFHEVPQNVGFSLGDHPTVT